MGPWCRVPLHNSQDGRILSDQTMSPRAERAKASLALGFIHWREKWCRKNDPRGKKTATTKNGEKGCYCTDCLHCKNIQQKLEIHSFLETQYWHLAFKSHHLTNSWKDKHLNCHLNLLLMEKTNNLQSGLRAIEFYPWGFDRIRLQWRILSAVSSFLTGTRRSSMLEYFQHKPWT